MRRYTIPALALAAALLSAAPFALAESDDTDDDRPAAQAKPMMQMGMKGHGRGMGMMGGMGPGGGPGMMTMLFTMIDANGDEELQLDEVQAVQERFFNRMDQDDNGSVSLEEMQAFAAKMHGG